MTDVPNVLETLLSMPMVDPMTAPEWNFHVSLWSEPLSFLCTRCAAKELAYPDMLTHLSEVHGLEPQPTPLAADVLNGGGAKFSLPLETLMELATYRVEEVDGETRYICLICERAGEEHWTAEEALMRQHLEQRHDGRFVEAPPDATPKDAPSQSAVSPDVMSLPTSPEIVTPTEEASSASPQSDQDTTPRSHEG